MPYTEEELAALSDTERAALTATDEDDDDTLEGIIGDDDGDDDLDDDGTDDDDSNDDDADKGDDKAAGDDKPADDIAVPDVNTAASLEDFDLDSVPGVTFIPKLSGEILPEYEEAITALDSRLDEGEISAADHRKEVRKLEAASQNEEIAKQLWQAEQAAFFKANSGYVQKTNPVEFAKLNKEVMKIANDPATRGLTGIQTMYLAKYNLSEAAEFAEFKAAKAAGKVPGTKPVEKTIPAKPSAKRPDQQTLRDVPAADNADVGQDKFSHLDKLSGMALEAAIANLSAADHAAYLAGA